MRPTPQQSSILDSVRNGTQNLTVSACAGSGKTTTIVKACSAAGDNVGMTAFNNHIVVELKDRLGQTAEATTLHSLGNRILRQHRPGIRMEKNKVRTLLKEMYPTLHQEGKGRWKGHFFLKPECECITDVINICRQQNVFPTDDETIRTIRTACYRQGVDLPAKQDKLWELATEATAAILEDTSRCDFADMLAMPLHHGWVRPQFKTLFVDECQDLSPVQHQLALGSADRIIGVGDDNQSIMAFAGADIDSFPNMTKHLSNRDRGCQILPLSVCFRCPTSHLDVARILVKDISAREGAEHGIIENATVTQLLNKSEPGDLVLCRNTAPLMRLAFAFIRAQKPVTVRGRAIGDGLLSIVKKLYATSITNFIDRLRQWREQQVAKLESADGSTDDALQRVLDQADSLQVLADDSKSVDELSSSIGKLFDDSDPSGRVCLSTVHRAKGLESNRVWIYEPGLMPSRPGVKQELNLLYVALTRSKSELYLVDGSIKRKDRSIEQWVGSVADGFSRWEITEDTNDSKEGLFDE